MHSDRWHHRFTHCHEFIIEMKQCMNNMICHKSSNDILSMDFCSYATHTHTMCVATRVHVCVRVCVYPCDCVLMTMYYRKCNMETEFYSAISFCYWVLREPFPPSQQHKYKAQNAPGPAKTSRRLNSGRWAHVHSICAKIHWSV